MKVYAHLAPAGSNGARLVREMIALDDALVPGQDVFPADVAAALVEVTALSPRPDQGWSTADGGKTFAAPPLPAAPVRHATGYALLMALTDAQRDLYAAAKPWDQRRLSARGSDPIPEGSPLVARVAAALKTDSAAWFDAALGAAG